MVALVFSMPSKIKCCLVVFAALNLMFALACSSGEQKATPPPPKVMVTSAVQKDVPIYGEWVGSMIGSVDVDIRPKVEAFLLKRLYIEGSYVNRGQAMFHLDPRRAQAAVDQAKANLERSQAALMQTRIDVDRYTPLAAMQAVSQAELDKAISSERAATAQVDASQAALDNAELNLGWTTVVSPISGIAGIAKVGDVTPLLSGLQISRFDPFCLEMIRWDRPTITIS